VETIFVQLRIGYQAEQRVRLQLFLRARHRLCAAAAPAFPLNLSFPLSCLPGLQGVSFGVFGLGNRQYEHFCAMGKKVSKAMQALGAAEVVPRGEGDDEAPGRAKKIALNKKCLF
jgi:hypothetical protein